MEKAQHRGPHGHLLTQPRAHHQHAPLVPSHLMESHLSHTHCHLPAVASSQPSTCWEKMHVCMWCICRGNFPSSDMNKTGPEAGCAAWSPQHTKQVPSPQALGSSDTHV